MEKTVFPGLPKRWMSPLRAKEELQQNFDPDEDNEDSYISSRRRLETAVKVLRDPGTCKLAPGEGYGPAFRRQQLTKHLSPQKESSSNQEQSKFEQIRQQLEKRLQSPRWEQQQQQQKQQLLKQKLSPRQTWQSKAQESPLLTSTFSVRAASLRATLQSRGPSRESSTRVSPDRRHTTYSTNSATFSPRPRSVSSPSKAEPPSAVSCKEEEAQLMAEIEELNRRLGTVREKSRSKDLRNVSMKAPPSPRTWSPPTSTPWTCTYSRTNLAPANSLSRGARAKLVGKERKGKANAAFR
eukprot:TRINITY_DN10462_c0_g1_i2.p1 TRINITY_DN10462_c0_g1~~TRINITY_DN10462_c0_g1_i2.p1  ORF type:complete len:296 (+),score=58.15 TRINITY_DN10462_c0_g1_i2:321-1208(+)